MYILEPYIELESLVSNKLLFFYLVETLVRLFHEKLIP